MHAVAGAIDVLLTRPFQAEHTVETVFRQFVLRPVGKKHATFRARAAHGEPVNLHVWRCLRPRFRDQMRFVPALRQRAKQPLEI